MLVAYIENGNTIFYNIPIELKDNIFSGIDFLTKYDLEKYRIGEMFNSIHAEEIIKTIPIDYTIITLGKYKKTIIDKKTTIRVFAALKKELLHDIEDYKVKEEIINETAKRIIAYKKGNKLLLFYVDSKADKSDKNEYYRKYYVGSFVASPITIELLNSMQVELMANQEEIETTIKM